MTCLVGSSSSWHSNSFFFTLVTGWRRNCKGGKQYNEIEKETARFRRGSKKATTGTWWTEDSGHGTQEPECCSAHLRRKPTESRWSAQDACVLGSGNRSASLSPAVRHCSLFAKSDAVFGVPAAPLEISKTTPKRERRSSSLSNADLQQMDERVGQTCQWPWEGQQRPIGRHRSYCYCNNDCCNYIG